MCPRTGAEPAWVTAHRDAVGWPATLSRARDAGGEPWGGTESVICSTVGALRRVPQNARQARRLRHLSPAGRRVQWVHPVPAPPDPPAAGAAEPRRGSARRVQAQPASRGTHPDRGPRDRGAPRCGPAPEPPASPPPARPPAISATTTVCARPGHDRGEDQRAERGDGSTARSARDRAETPDRQSPLPGDDHRGHPRAADAAPSAYGLRLRDGSPRPTRALQASSTTNNNRREVGPLQASTVTRTTPRARSGSWETDSYGLDRVGVAGLVESRLLGPSRTSSRGRAGASLGVRHESVLVGPSGAAPPHARRALPATRLHVARTLGAFLTTSSKSLHPRWTGTVERSNLP